MRRAAALSRMPGPFLVVFRREPSRLVSKNGGKMQKTALAERILKSAACGERDRKRLRDAALALAA
jgi:hypothetical protein